MRVLGTLLLLAAAAAAEPVRHELTVRLDPATHGIEIVDRIAGGGDRFRLHAGLAVESLDPKVTVRVVREIGDAAVPLKEYAVTGPADAQLHLRLKGKIHHPLVSEEQEYARSFSRTPGTISEQGVVLSGGTYWLPAFGDRLVTFNMKVALPDGWTSVSQGARTAANTWDCPHPMDEVYLIAARFVVYERPAGGVTTYAFLRGEDPALAAKYLETTAQYLEMYRKLLGRYPYRKFALVENFWETGYGMPSFTLLGPQIIRFPFILHSSYPHEILHNWWGNSVFVDWEKGNWCEGLTAYLADHLVKEGHGQGELYRRDTLKKYRNYVRAGLDFPLKDFRSRHSSATEAVGYGKALMLFHMLRIKLGDEAFVRGLQEFYRRFRFQRASFGDLAEVFGEEQFFAQWVEKTGAATVLSEWKGDELVLAQPKWPYRIVVPVAFTIEGEEQATVARVALGNRATVKVPAGTVRIDVDPYFDVFRVLDRAEIPPTLGAVFGADAVTIVTTPGWEAVAQAWSRSDAVEVVGAKDLDALPPDRAVWILGSDNPWKQALAPFLAERRAGLDADGAVRVGGARHPPAGTSFVFTAPHPGDPERAIGWIGGGTAAARPGLARKLPHYGKYSYLAFAGDEPTNVAKGQWDPAGSPLVHGAEHPRAALPKREPLARLAPVFDRERLMAHVRFLADPKLEGRGAGTAGLDVAADYIAAAFKEAGLETRFQDWTEENGPGGKPVRLRNVVGVLPGTKWPDEAVVLGAHYDHLGRGWPHAREGAAGEIHNGADDNASGVAVALELARLLGQGHRPQRTMVFVAFSGEEWGLKGSRRFVKMMRRKAFAMVNLDTVGRLEGKKLTLLGTGTASEWKHIAMGVGYTTGVEAVCIPQDPGGSDQVSFHKAGVPAIQVFTGAHEDYHRPTDDVEKVDGSGLVQVATFVRETIVYLGERDRPLTSSLRAGGKAPERPMPGRRVSLGTVPDFAYPGPGVRIKSVLDDTAAAAAGLEAGDVLLAMDGTDLKDLRGFTRALAGYEPGAKVEIRFRRGDEEKTVEATLKAR